jgi:hypothetical protein
MLTWQSRADQRTWQQITHQFVDRVPDTIPLLCVAVFDVDQEIVVSDRTNHGSPPSFSASPEGRAGARKSNRRSDARGCGCAVSRRIATWWSSTPRQHRALSRAVAIWCTAFLTRAMKRVTSSASSSGARGAARRGKVLTTPDRWRRRAHGDPPALGRRPHRVRQLSWSPGNAIWQRPPRREACASGLPRRRGTVTRSLLRIGDPFRSPGR